MTGSDMVPQTEDSFRLGAAANEFARAETDMMVKSVVDELKARPGQDTFPEVASRSLWDEYCWSIQKGPFDETVGIGDLSLGSVASAFESLVYDVIEATVEKRPKHALIFLSAKAFEESEQIFEESLAGSIWIDGIVALVLEELDRLAASRRNLDFIGPERAEIIPYEIDGGGMVWQVLSDRNEIGDLFANHYDTLLDPNADLSFLAEELLEAFMAALAEDDGLVCPALLENFESEVRILAMEKDILPSLADIRLSLQKLADI